MNNTIKWLYKVPGKKCGYVLLLIALQAATGGIGVLYALFLRNVIDSAVAHNVVEFWHNVVLTVSLVVLWLVLNALNRWINTLASSDIENCFKQRLMDNILKKDYASVSAIHSGEWLNRLTNDTQVVASGYVNILPGLVGTTVRLVCAVVLIIALDKWFAYILIPGGILLILITYLFRKKLKKLHKNIQEKDGKLRVFLQERISGLMMIKSFSAEKQTGADAAGYMSAHKAARMRHSWFSNFCNTGLGFVMQGFYLVGVVYCAYGIIINTVTYGTLVAIMQLIGQIQAPFANISGYLPRWYATVASAERLMEIEQFDDDDTNEALSADEANEYYRKSLQTFGLKNACFTYFPVKDTIGEMNKDNMPEAISNLSIEVQKGEYVAFTGHSGCGKSTALKLFISLYKLDSGSRFLRGNNGDIIELSSKFRRLFAYVPQGNQLFNGTIRDVVSFSDYNRAKDDAKISQALKIACADEFLDDLENGLDTLLGERGQGLSEGQAQRIAIARAIFSDSPILLLDEATSALDAKTEARLLSNLRSLTDKTVLIVTHRSEALKICDRVLRFKENGVEEA